MQTSGYRDWGITASVQLLTKHVWSLTFIASAWAVILAILTMDAIEVNPSSLGQLDVLNHLPNVIFPVLFSYLFLSGEKFTVTGRGVVLAIVVLIAFEVLHFVPSIILQTIKEAGVFGAQSVDSVYSSLRIGYAFIMLLAYLYTFCLVPQTLRDGAVSLQAALKGVASRGALALGLFAISYGGMAIVGFLAVKSASVFDLKISVGMGIVVGSLVTSLLAACYSAVGFVWLLNPRARSPEESTTWVVPNSASAVVQDS